jgi:hypothetical protein
MRRILLAAAACLATFGAGVAPNAAMADSPSPGTANIAVSVSVFTRASDGRYSVPAADPSAPIMIGSSEEVRADVTNAGPDATTVTIHLSEVGTGDPHGMGTWTPWPGPARDSATCSGIISLPDWCTFTLPAGGSWAIYPFVVARFPGAAGITFTATETASDPDPTDNIAEWPASPPAAVAATTRSSPSRVRSPSPAATGTTPS